MRQYYYWIYTRDNTGKPYIIYGGDREEDARRKGLEILGGMDFSIKKLPTRDKNAASGYIRGTRLQNSHNIKESTRRIGRSKSLSRLRQKYLHW